MKKLRKFSMAVLLTFAFATCGFAGIMPTVPGPEPPPPDSQSATGITDTPPQSQTAPTDIEFALSILQSLLATF
jgi:hypothetical protein